MGPTHPGTGLIVAMVSIFSNSESPHHFPSTRLHPTSMMIDQGVIISTFKSPGLPAATMTISLAFV